MKNPDVILSIAGSDPSGGAGIQADIKTISALGSYAAAAITAVTAQNTQTVSLVQYMPSTLVRDQIKAVLDDLDVKAIKIGMTGQYDTIKAISSLLLKRRDIPVVLDPVMVSTSGRRLTDDKALRALPLFLLPLSRLSTPNLHEASVLLGAKVRTVDDMRQAARALHGRHQCAFLIKGGHVEGDEMVDVLFDGEFHYFTAPRIETPNLHGTGCTLSSAIATFIGRGYELHDAVREAKDYLGRALQAGSQLRIGHGNGPLWHLTDQFPITEE